MNNKLRLTSVNILFFIFTAVFLVYQIVMAVILGETINDRMYLIVIINEFLIAASVLIYCFAMKINIKETFRLNNPGIIPLLLIAAAALPATLTAGMLNSIVIFLLQNIGSLPAPSIPIPQNLMELLTGVLVIAVLPGICEEIMHRGLLLRAYEKRGSYRAVVIVAIFFGLFHFDITNLLGPIFLGLIIGYYVVRTDSLYAGIFAHFLNNTVSEIIQYLSKEVRPEKLTISTAEFIQTVLLGLVCLGITAGLLFLFKMATRGKANIIAPIDRARQDAKVVLTHWPIISIIVMYFLMMMLYIFSIVITKKMGM